MNTDLSIEIGTNLQLEIKAGTAKSKNEPAEVRRLSGELLGIEPGKYLTVRLALPPTEDVSKLLSPKRQIIVRYIHEGCVFGFQSAVLDKITHPLIDLLFVLHPEEIRNSNLRKHPRIACYLPAKVTIENYTIEGRIINMSQGGCQLEVGITKLGQGDVLEMDKPLYMALQLPGIEKEIVVTGRLKNLKKEKAVLSLGCSFDKATNIIQEKARNILNKYILNGTP